MNRRLFRLACLYILKTFNSIPTWLILFDLHENFFFVSISLSHSLQAPPNKYLTSLTEKKRDSFFFFSWKWEGKALKPIRFFSCLKMYLSAVFLSMLDNESCKIRHSNGHQLSMAPLTPRRPVNCLLFFSFTKDESHLTKKKENLPNFCLWEERKRERERGGGGIMMLMEINFPLCEGPVVFS